MIGNRCTILLERRMLHLLTHPQERNEEADGLANLTMNNEAEKTIIEMLNEKEI